MNFIGQMLFSIGIKKNYESLVFLFYRGILSVLIMTHGYSKLVNFEKLSTTFVDYVISSKISLILVIFSEFFCAIFLIIGFMSRFSALMLSITLGMAVYHHMGLNDGKQLLPLLYALSFVLIFLMGPGKYSIDYFIHQK